jgi:hypothetical protein
VNVTSFGIGFGIASTLQNFPLTSPYATDLTYGATDPLNGLYDCESNSLFVKSASFPVNDNTFLILLNANYRLSMKI